MSEPIVRVAAKALIVNELGEVLILREASTYTEGTNIGKWGVPGGRLNPGEHYQDGLLREVKEETGLEVTIESPVYIGEWMPRINGVDFQIVGVYSKCHALPADIILSEEHDAYKWVNTESIETVNIMPSDIDAVKSVTNLVTKND